MTTVVTAEKAIELLERAVQEKGADYVDPAYNTTGCEYADEQGQPLCIVGHVLNYLNVDLRPIEDNRDGEYPSGRPRPWGHDFSAGELRHESWKAPLGDVEFTVGAANVLAYAQSDQDNGKAWGEAVEAAKEVA